VFAITVADLVFRARQFLIAVVGVGLVLAMALLLSGLAAGFRSEVQGTVGAVNATQWILSKSAHGRITAFAAFPELDAVSVQGEPGVRSAAPLLVVPFQVAHVGPTFVTSTVIGVVPGRLGDPAVDSGHMLRGPNEVVIDNKLHAALGSDILLGRHALRVVGVTSDRTLTGGMPVIYTTLASAQAVITGGQPLITAVVATSDVSHLKGLPSGLVALTPDQVVSDTVGQLATAVASINNTRWLMWAVAIVIVASVLYVAALERRQDFAVLKALGSSSSALFASLLFESVVVTLTATALAEVLVMGIIPLFTQPVDLTPGARATLPVVAIAVGTVASLSALRRVTKADPATAFG
jgi:putative ABC transport system permease protein